MPKIAIEAVRAALDTDLPLCDVPATFESEVFAVLRRAHDSCPPGWGLRTLRLERLAELRRLREEERARRLELPGYFSMMLAMVDGVVQEAEEAVEELMAQRPAQVFGKDQLLH